MMNRTSIEDRDRRLMKKFRDIVEQKELHKKQPPPRRRSWAAFILAGFIMVAAIMFMVSHMIPERVLTDPSFSPGEPKTAESKDSVPMAHYTYSEVEMLDLPNENKTNSETVTPGPEDLVGEVQPVPESPQLTETLPPPNQRPEQVPSSDVTIEELVTCQGIKNRQYTSPQNRFSLTGSEPPVIWIWMNVLTGQAPQTLSHIYYLNGQRYCRVILRIPYPRTRTWSNVTLNRPEHAGTWRVDVVNSRGEVIGRTDFTVEP